MRLFGLKPAPATDEFATIGARPGWLKGEVADGWYRGEQVNFYPDKRIEGRQFEASEIDKHIIGGWAPKAPFIKKSDLLTAFGSCFARNVEFFLRRSGYTTSISRYGDAETSNYWSNSLIVKCGEGFVNTFSIRTQFEWIFDDTMPPINIWQKSDGEIKEFVDSNRDAAHQLFMETDCFVITLGLSEVWYNKQSGKVLWTGVPAKHFDPDVYGFRVSTANENLDNLNAIVNLIRRERGDVPIVFTVSPVPLKATFRDVPCITANAVSKAVLRVAVDELIRGRDRDQKLFYFPAYEMVTSYFSNPLDADQMHPHPTVLKAIMETFERNYCVPTA